jgi:hypothetical protein
MSWGGESWGGNWGGSSEALSGFWVASAYSRNADSFVIAYSARPTYASPIWPGDAGNLQNFVLTNLDTGLAEGILATRIVLTDLNTIEYVLASPFRSSLAGYRVTAANLIGYVGEELIDPKFADFPGMAPSQLPAKTLRPTIDLYNPQVSGEYLNGGLVIGSDGDYVKEAGTPFLRKLIVRRILTAQSEFYHLAGISYGLGVEAKALPTTADLVVLRTRMAEEIGKEPEVADVRVSLLLSPNHVLNVTVTAQLKRTGQQISLSIPLPQAVQL